MAPSEARALTPVSANGKGRFARLPAEDLGSRRCLVISLVIARHPLLWVSCHTFLERFIGLTGS